MDINSIIATLSAYEPDLLAETSPCAAVLVILLINETNHVEIVLTKRSASLPTYAGQYCFPGGFHDDNDTDLLATAAREASEELSLAADSYQYIAELDDFQDHDGNLVRPFVAVMQKNKFAALHKKSSDEIAEIYYFPIGKLPEIRDDTNIYPITNRRPAYSFTDGDVFVWGLTATILVHFFNIISGAKKPIGKYIQSN